MISKDLQNRKLDLATLSSLFTEIDKEYINVHKKITFDY